MTKPATITAIKGFRDVLPDESVRWQALETAAARIFGSYGFGDVRLPVLERAELFARSLGETTDVVEKEMYSFPDRDETIVTLRPEATASVVRAYVESGIGKREPVSRFWYAGPMFRRERPQKGRYRQFQQIGVEMLGRSDALADAELLTMLSDYLAAVAVPDVTLELNSLGDHVCRPVYRERLQAFGREHLAELCQDCHRRIERNPLRLLDCKVPACRAVMQNAPVMLDHLCAPCREHFDEVRALLDRERVAYTLNTRLVRGLDYYCRTAFEVIAGGLGAQNAVGGGGRYDGLVAALGGGDVPGTGFALGVDRLAMLLESTDAQAPPPAAVILPLDPRAVGPALDIATRLRREGVGVIVEAAGRSLKSLLRAADRQRAAVAIILGEDELRTGRATIRNLVRREDRPQALALDAPGPELARHVRSEAGSETLT
jgi:histidyl-tRNA synthetase